MSRAGKSRQLPLDKKMKIAREATEKIVKKYIDRHQKRRREEVVYGTDMRTYHTTMVIGNVLKYLKKRNWMKLYPMLERYAIELLDDFCYGNALHSRRPISRHPIGELPSSLLDLLKEEP